MLDRRDRPSELLRGFRRSYKRKDRKTCARCRFSYRWPSLHDWRTLSKIHHRSRTSIVKMSSSVVNMSWAFRMKRPRIISDCSTTEEKSTSGPTTRKIRRVSIKFERTSGISPRCLPQAISMRRITGAFQPLIPCRTRGGLNFLDSS